MKKIFLSTIILFNTILFAGFKTIIVSTTPKLQTKTFVDELSSENPQLIITTNTIITKKLAVNATTYLGVLDGLYLRGYLYYQNETAGSNKVLICAGGDGKAYWGDLTNIGGDNLGNHVATTTLNMNYYDITNVGWIHGAGIETMDANIDIFKNSPYFQYGIDVATLNVRNYGNIKDTLTVGKKVNASDIEATYGIKASTAYVAGMTFYNQSIQGNDIVGLFGDNGSRLHSGSGASLKVYSDIDIIPAAGYKTNVYSDLDMQTKNITNVNQLNANTIITNYVSATSSITTNGIRASTVYNDIYILHLHGSGGVVLGSLDNSALVKIYNNDDIILIPPLNNTINLFVPTSSTAGSLAGYMTIKVNNQTYKVPLYNP